LLRSYTLAGYVEVKSEKKNNFKKKYIKLHFGAVKYYGVKMFTHVNMRKNPKITKKNTVFF